MKLTIQIVNFRSRHYLRKCLFSIGENLPAGNETEILIVNNDEEALDEISDDLKNKLNLQIIETRKNIGFGRGHNAGFERSQGEYVLFLNPDTKILSGALQALLDVFAKDEKIGIAGPLLVDSAGKIHPDCFGARHTPLSTIKRKIFKRNSRQFRVGEEIFETDWISGGAMLARRDVFEEAGGFDENFFMYFEDADLCLRAKKLGLKIMVNPEASVFHESGKSFVSEREKKRHYYASQDYYLRKHFGPVSASLVKLIRLPYYIKNVWLG
ncbi:MAG: glycosyltransferase family 2 protein [Candidatus Moraniibacteriota bacterium]